MTVANAEGHGPLIPPDPRKDPRPGTSPSIGLSYTNFGLTLIGGLTTATLLTLLVVPVFCTFFGDAHVVVGRALRHAAAQPATPEGTETTRGG